MLIKLYKISDGNRFDRLLHQTDLGDRKPTELLSVLRTLLGESCSDNAEPSKLLHKLFLDKLPPQVQNFFQTKQVVVVITSQPLFCTTMSEDNKSYEQIKLFGV